MKRCSFLVNIVLEINSSIRPHASSTGGHVASSGRGEVDEVVVEGDFFCQITLGGRKSWGNCSDSCFDDYNGKGTSVLKWSLGK